ncbi:hypothetical protein Metho_0591 [Methanomethylovorans hollandica DSM 15978]|uniref:Uncharacterized protein n=1 Tax=Methanomethylovorans hollandica (strain DSM 15978 / NBRC 107637 / DMS1) TaxID=867904 RepID=L0KUR7_METHD|nr:hypothetical protein [Methanomethylovorans hollandica]AGB48856.1 hypothetical protein Metho_0591 [Methanomethylovorans hollandica DSM 15978]
MGKFTIGTIALFVLLAMALSVTAAPPEHQATGGGWFIVPNEDGEEQKTTVSFTAQIDAEGNVKGQMQAQIMSPYGKLTFHGDVIDLEVNDNVAIMMVRITKVSDPDMLLIGTQFPVEVTDNGEGKDAIDIFAGLPFNGNIQVS